MSDIMQLREFLVAEEQCCGGVTVIGGAKAATFFRRVWSLFISSSISLAGAKSTSNILS